MHRKINGSIQLSTFCLPCDLFCLISLRDKLDLLLSYEKRVVSTTDSAGKNKISAIKQKPLLLEKFMSYFCCHTRTLDPSGWCLSKNMSTDDDLPWITSNPK